MNEMIYYDSILHIYKIINDYLNCITGSSSCARHDSEGKRINHKNRR